MRDTEEKDPAQDDIISLEEEKKDPINNFMIGSGDMNVDGILKDEIAESVMRNGEWAFEI